MSRFGRPNDEARRLHRRGIRARNRADWPAALALFQAVRALEEATCADSRDWGDYGKTLHEIASCHLELGDLEAARAGFAAARAAKEREPADARDWEGYSRTLHELAFAQRRLRLTDEALHTVADNLAANRHIPDDGTRELANASAQHLVARLHADAERWDAAATAAAATADHASRVSSPTGLRLAREAHCGLAYAMVELERWDDALAAALAGRALLEQMPLTERDWELCSTMLNDLAIAQYMLGRHDEALRTLEDNLAANRHLADDAARTEADATARSGIARIESHLAKVGLRLARRIPGAGC